jgi:hypothetical protein
MNTTQAQFELGLIDEAKRESQMQFLTEKFFGPGLHWSVAFSVLKQIEQGKVNPRVMEYRKWRLTSTAMSAASPNKKEAVVDETTPF